MYTLKIDRHGPKNNDPKAHQTGVEALLDPSKIRNIISYAAEQLSMVTGGETVEIETTPIDRAIATGSIVYEVMRLDPRLKGYLTPPKVNELIGSSGIDPNGEAVNLGPKAMSKIWGAAKNQDVYQGQEGEHRPLYAWCEQGFDNLGNLTADDPNGLIGISLREIACRLGTYVHQKLSFMDGKEKITFAFGHSGDIEPFLYLCLEMLDGRDGSDPEAMVRQFIKTAGALEPLRGITLVYEKPRNLYLYYLGGKPKAPMHITKKSIGLEILQEQANWLRKNGRSQEVLEQKLAKG